MQRFKEQFRDPNFKGTLSNIQSCLRVNDLDEVGDGTHGLKFDMMGLFSFREMSVPHTIDFWFDFLERIGISPDRVTIHPDRPEWRDFYRGRNVVVDHDPECVWSDGDQGGYCTEFYVGEVEIGNIVNTNGDCIDVGFGLDRLLRLLGDPPRTRSDEIILTLQSMLNSGYQPGHYRQGFVMKKLLRELYRCGGSWDHPLYRDEIERQEKLKRKFERLWPKYSHMSQDWWRDTHGIIDVNDYLK
jgi:alanyl-tRNA synthetase